MRLETFRGRNLPSVFDDVRARLGEDAMIAHSRIVYAGKETLVEVVAVDADDIAKFRRQLLSPEVVSTARPRVRRRDRPPFVIAVVGPSGSGKTTTAAKIARHTEAFGKSRVGFIALDTHRAASPERLQQLSYGANLPIEVVADLKQLDRALKRLASLDVVVVDTPGHGPRGASENTMWRSILNRLEPDEMHLVVSATTRPDLASRIRNEWMVTGATHVLLTKLDEVPNDANVAKLAADLSLPIRWITDGQYVPIDLQPAQARLLTTLGVAPSVEVSA